MVCTRDTRDVAVNAAKMVGLPLSRVVVVESEEGKWSFKSVDGGIDLFTSSRLAWERVTDRRVLEDRTVVLLYSSGTTGVPKGLS